MSSRDRGRGWGVAGILTVALFLLTAPAALAVENETFGMLPRPRNVANTERRTFAVPLEPGSVFEDAVRVYNKTDQPLDLIIYAADAETGVDGTVSVGFRGSASKGVGAWIRLPRETLNLPPRGEATVRFRIEVRSANPSPDLGAIVVENVERGIATDLAERLHVVVRPSPPNSATTSVRVRPLLLRSPWVIVATVGLFVALVIVWLGARRARHPKDALVPSGGLRDAPEEVTPAASRPVVRRLGATEPGGSRRRQNAEIGARRNSRSARVSAENEDERPILDDSLVDLDEPRQRAAVTRNRSGKRRPSASAKSGASRQRRKETQAQRGGRYIPLDDL